MRDDEPTECVQYFVLVVGRPIGDGAEQVVVLGRQSVVEQRQEEHAVVAAVDVRVARVRVAEVADVVQTTSTRPRRGPSASGRRRCRL